MSRILHHFYIYKCVLTILTLYLSNVFTQIGGMMLIFTLFPVAFKNTLEDILYYSVIYVLIQKHQ